MPDKFKLHLNQKIDFYIGKKLVSVGPRGTIKLAEKDIESSPQVQELLARKAFRKLPKTKARASADSAKPKRKSTGDAKKKG